MLPARKKKVTKKPQYTEHKFRTIKAANAYANANRYSWYTSTLFASKGVDGCKEFAPGKQILVAMVDETNVIYYK